MISKLNLATIAKKSAATMPSGSALMAEALVRGADEGPTSAINAVGAIAFLPEARIANPVSAAGIDDP
jgi:hypothetical protein